MILAIDPGTTESGWVIFNGSVVEQCGISKNGEVLDIIARHSRTASMVAIEKVESYGMAVGKTVFETCMWAGEFRCMAKMQEIQVAMIGRKAVKMHLCGSMKAKDTNIRQALIDRYGEPGTKKNPGPTYGCKSHIWAALAVASTAIGD